MANRIWILGAPDPEMEAIESLLRECGETVRYATDEHGERATAAGAYAPGCTWYSEQQPDPTGAGDIAGEDYTLYCVECRPTSRTHVLIDHHCPGDPGYGRPPSEFFAASSLGQVIAALARIGRLPEWRVAEQGLESATAGVVRWNPYGPYWHVGLSAADAAQRAQWGEPLHGWSAIVPHELVLIAAADHCLGAAYRGECPGVDPEQGRRRDV